MPRYKVSPDSTPKKKKPKAKSFRSLPMHDQKRKYHAFGSLVALYEYLYRFDIPEEEYDSLRRLLQTKPYDTTIPRTPYVEPIGLQAHQPKRWFQFLADVRPKRTQPDVGIGVLRPTDLDGWKIIRKGYRMERTYIKRHGYVCARLLDLGLTAQHLGYYSTLGSQAVRPFLHYDVPIVEPYMEKLKMGIKEMAHRYSASAQKRQEIASSEGDEPVGA